MYRAFILSTLALPTFVLSHIHYQHPAVPVPTPIVVRHRHVDAPPPTPAPQPTSTPVTTPTPTPKPSSTVCMNFGYDPYPFNYSTIDFYLGKLKEAGINCLRLGYYGYGGSPSTYTSGNYIPEQLATHIIGWAKSNNWHFSLTLGGSYDNRINSSDFPAYDASVDALAEWAEANGIERISLGNEQEYRLGNISISQWASHLNTLATAVRAVYKGEIVYDVSGDYITQYCGLLSDLDRVGINLYAGFSNLSSQALSCFPKVYASEFNVDMATGNFNNDQTHANDIKTALTEIHSITPYFFVMSAGGNGVPTFWALYNGTSLAQPKTAAVLGL